jgi:hypothetical protein
MAKRKKISKKIKKSGFDLILHPFFAAIYPIVFLFAYNLKEVYVGSMTGPLILSCLGTLALFLILRLLIKDSMTAGLITTAGVLVFFSYGHMYKMIQSLDMDWFAAYGHIALVPFIMALAAAVTWALINTERLREINLILNAALGLLLLFVIGQSVYGVMVYHSAAYEKFSQSVKKTTLEARKNAVPGKYPDIYYIILDGHARQDVAKEMFDYDDSFFIKHLEDKGFYVAKKSRPNYCMTYLSLASSLNMEYLDDVAKNSEKGNIARIFLGEMIRHNKTVDTLRQYGYIWVSYFTGFVGTELKKIADIYLPGEDVFAEEMSEFSSILLDSTLVYGVQGIRNMGAGKKTGTYVAFQRRTQYIMENIDKAAGIAPPKIVFAHIVAPHPPFVFDENGPTDKYVGTGGIEFAGGDQNPMPRDEYRKGYKAQMKYVDTKMCGVVDRLLAATSGKAIIIIQGDHGPGSEWFVNDYEKTNKKERFSILNAYYLPGGMKKDLYESITPVNSFRLIFKDYFGLDMPLLPDKSYYSTWNDPFKFIEVPGE